MKDGAMFSKTCRRPFNLIEIVLAMGALAVGAVSVMALFPVGANAARDAMAENYASESADQFLHWLKYQIRQSGGWTNYITGGSPWIGDTDPTDTDRSAFTGGAAFDSGTIFRDDSYGTGYRRFRIQRTTDVARGTPPVTTTVTDFEAVAVLWREKVVIPRPAASPPYFIELPYTTAVAINVEVTWPMGLPVSQRQRATYHFELFNR